MKRIIIFIIAVLTMATVQGQTLTKKQKGLAACAFPVGEPNVNCAQYFIGDSFVAPLEPVTDEVYNKLK